MSITLQRRVRAAERAAKALVPDDPIRTIVVCGLRPHGDRSRPVCLTAGDRVWNRVPGESYDAFAARAGAAAADGTGGPVWLFERFPA